MSDFKNYIIGVSLREKDLKEIETRMQTTMSDAMANGMSLDRKGKAVVKKDMETLLGYVRELTSGISNSTPDVAEKLLGNLKNVLPMIAGLADKMKQVNSSTDWMKQGFTFGDDIYTTIKALDTVQQNVAEVRAEVAELTTSLNPFMNALKANDPSAFFKKFGDGFKSVGDGAQAEANNIINTTATINTRLDKIRMQSEKMQKEYDKIKASARNFTDIKSLEEARNLYEEITDAVINYGFQLDQIESGVTKRPGAKKMQGLQKDYMKSLIELQNFYATDFGKQLYQEDVKSGYAEDLGYLSQELKKTTSEIEATIKQAGKDLQNTVANLHLKNIELSVVLPEANQQEIEKRANEWVEGFNKEFKAKPVQLSVDMADPFRTYRTKSKGLTDAQKKKIAKVEQEALESLRGISGDENLEATFGGLDDPETGRILKKLAESFTKIRKGVELGQKSILDATREWRSEIEKLLTLSFKWSKVDVGDGAQELLENLQAIMTKTPMKINVNTNYLIQQIENAFKDANFNISGTFTGSGSSKFIFTDAPVFENSSEQDAPPKTPTTPPTPPKSSETPKSDETAKKVAETVVKPANALTRAVEELKAEKQSLEYKKQLGQEAEAQKKAAKENAEANLVQYNKEKDKVNAEIADLKNQISRLQETSDGSDDVDKEQTSTIAKLRGKIQNLQDRIKALDGQIKAAETAKNADIKEYDGKSKDDKIKVLDKRQNAIQKVLDNQEDPSKLIVDTVNQFYKNNNDRADDLLDKIAPVDKDLAAKYAKVIDLEKQISKLNPSTDGDKISELRAEVERLKPEIDMLFKGITTDVVAEYVALEKQIEDAKRRYAKTNSKDDKLALDGLQKRHGEIESGLGYLRDTKGVDNAFFEKFKEAVDLERKIAELDPRKDQSTILDLKIQLKKIVEEMGKLFQGLKDKTAKELSDIEAQLEEKRRQYNLAQSEKDKSKYEREINKLEYKKKTLTGAQNAVPWLENNRLKKQLFEQTGFRDYSGTDINTAIQFVNEILRGSTTLADTISHLSANGVNLKNNNIDNLVYFIPRVQEMMGIVAQSSQEWERTDELKQRFLHIADLLQQISGLFSIQGGEATSRSLQEFINVFGKVRTLQPVVEAAKNHLDNLLATSNFVGQNELYEGLLLEDDVDSTLFGVMKHYYSSLPKGIQKELKAVVPSLDFTKIDDKEIDDKTQQFITDKFIAAFKSGALDSNVFEKLKAGAPALQDFYDILKLIVLLANQSETQRALSRLTGASISKLQGQITKDDSMVATVDDGGTKVTYGFQTKEQNRRHPIPGVTYSRSYNTQKFLSNLDLDELVHEKFILGQGLFAERDKLQNELNEMLAKEDSVVDETAVQRIRTRLDAIAGILKDSGTTATSEAEAKARIKEINEKIFENMSLSSPKDFVKQEYKYGKTEYAKAKERLAYATKAETERLNAILNSQAAAMDAVRALIEDQRLAEYNADVASVNAEKYKGYDGTKLHHRETLDSIFNKNVGEYTDKNGNTQVMSEMRDRLLTALQYKTMDSNIINSLLPKLDEYEVDYAELSRMPADTMLTEDQIDHKDALKAKIRELKNEILRVYYKAENWLVNDILTREIQSIETQAAAATREVTNDDSGVKSQFDTLKSEEIARYNAQRSQIESKYADQIDLGGGMSEVVSAYEQERRQIISNKYEQAISDFEQQQTEEFKAFESEIMQKRRDPYAKYREAKDLYEKEQTEASEEKYKAAEREYLAVKTQGDMDLLAFQRKQENDLAKAKKDEWNKATSEVPNKLEELRNAASEAANLSVERITEAKKEELRREWQKRIESGELSEEDAQKGYDLEVAKLTSPRGQGTIKRAITTARNAANKALEDFIKAVAEKFGITADLVKKTLEESIIKGDKVAEQEELDAAKKEHEARMADIEAQRVEALKAQQEANDAAYEKAKQEQAEAEKKAVAGLQTSKGHWLSDKTLIGQIGRGERAGAVKDMNEAKAMAQNLEQQRKALMDEHGITKGMIDGTEQLVELQREQTEAMRSSANEVEKQKDVAKQSTEATRESTEATKGQQQYTSSSGSGGGIVPISTGGLATENTLSRAYGVLQGIWQLLNGGPPQGGWGDIQGIVARTFDELLPEEKVFADSMAGVFKAYEEIDYETAAAIGKGGLIGALKQGNSRHVDQQTFDVALAQAVKEEVLALLHNHPSKLNALTIQDVESGVFNANNNRYVKMSGSVGDKAITAIDFTEINETIGAKIVERYRFYLNQLAEDGTGRFGWKDVEKTRFSVNPDILNNPEIKAGVERLINDALMYSLVDCDRMDAFKVFDLSDMQGFMQSIVKPAQEQVAENVVRAGAQAAVDSVEPAPITPNPKPTRQRTMAEDVLDDLRSIYKIDPNFAKVDGQKSLYDAIKKVNSYSHAKDQGSDQALRDLGNAYVKIQKALDQEVFKMLGENTRRKINTILERAKEKLAENKVEINDSLIGQVITPELLSQLQAKKGADIKVGKIIGSENSRIMTRDGKPLQSAYVSSRNPKNKAEEAIVAEALGLEKKITNETEEQANNKAKKGAKQGKVKEEAAAEAAVTAEQEEQLNLAEKTEKIEDKTASDLQAQAQAAADTNKSKIEPAPIESASGIPQGTGGGLPSIANTFSQILNVVAKDETVREIISTLTNGIKTSGAGGKQPDDGVHEAKDIGHDAALEAMTKYANDLYPGAVRTSDVRANANSYSVDFWRKVAADQDEVKAIEEDINKMKADGVKDEQAYIELLKQKEALLQRQEKITVKINKENPDDITSKVGIQNYALGANAAEKELSKFQGILSQLHETGAVGFKSDGSLTSQNQTIDSWLVKMQDLQAKQDELKANGTLFAAANQPELSKMTAETAQLTKEVMGLLNVESKFGGKVVGTLDRPEVLSQSGELYGKLLGIANATGKVDMATVKFNDTTNTMTYTVQVSKNQVQDMTLHMNALNGAVTQNVIQTRHVDTAWQAFGKSLKGKWQEVARYLTTFGSIYRIWGIIKQGVNYVKEIDTALVELKKVTEATDRQYAQFLQTMSKTAGVVGSTTSELTKSAAEWARLGYSMQEAGKLAESTAILMNVSEFDDVNKATEALISSLQAFNYTADDSIKIVDKLNIVGNNFAISSDGIAEGLQRSASTLVAAGNSLEQSIAMLAAGNKVAQDPEALGNALKVLSMRIRGTKTELEEAGEETDGLITNTSKLRDKVKALTDVNGSGGVDILTDTGAYRSTYEILLDIAEIWDDINDADPKNQAALLELLAGKTRGSQLAAILQNPEDLRDAYEMALDSDGSAAKELDTYLDSIEGKMKLFTNSVQTMWMNLIDSKTVKGLVDLGTALVKIADKVGVINILFAALTTSLMRKAGISGVEAFFSKTVVSVDQAQAKLKELQTQYDQLGSSASKENVRKQKQIKQQMEPYDAIVKGAEKEKIAQDNLATAQDKLKTAEANLANAREQGYAPKVITRYKNAVEDAKKNVDEAEVAVQSVEAANKKLDTSGKIAWANLKVGAQAFAKQLQQTLTSMATMFLISKVIEGIIWVFDKLQETIEESKEKFDNLVSELDSTKSGLDDLESKLEDINKQIEEINENTPLSFTDEEDLKRLKAESAELEQQIKFQKMIAEQQQGKVNQEAVKQVNKYKQTVGSSGKTSSEIMGQSIGTGAAIGTAAGLTTLGTAIGGALVGAIKGGASGAAAGPWGIVAGALIGLALGVAGGAIAGGVQLNQEGSTVGDTLTNMDTNYADLEKKMVEARNKALKTGSEKDQKAYEEAQENFTNFKANVANYFSEMGTYFDNMDMETATESEKAAYEEYKTLQDKWSIINNGDDATKNALDRLFGEDADEVVKAYANIAKNAVEAGEAFDFTDADAETIGLDDDLETLGITTQQVTKYFKDFGNTGADAIEEIDVKDLVSELSKVEGALESVQSVMEEFRTDGIVSASTLDGMDEEIKGLGEAWENYVNTMLSGTATMADAKVATEALAKAYLDKNANNIDKKTRLSYIAQLEKFGNIENAAELVDSYINNDFFDATNIKPAVTEFSKLSDQIAEAADAYDDIIEKDKIWSKGNVDYNNRPIISAETMQEKYPEFDSDDYATTYDMDKAILDSDGNIAYTVKVTPILEDGTVIDEETLTKYVEGVLQDAYNNGGVQGVLDADKNGYNIVIATAVGEVERDSEGFSELDKVLQGAKDSHLELVNMSAQKLIDLAAENDIVLELADAYKILQAAEKARLLESQPNEQVQKRAEAEKRNKQKQETANTLRTDERYIEFQHLIPQIEKINNREGFFKNYTDEEAKKAIERYTEELKYYLGKYGYTLEDAFPTLEVVPKITVSKEEVANAKKEYEAALDNMDSTVTPRVDMNPADTIEEISEIESGFESLSGAYNEFIEEGVASAGTLAGLKDTFDVVGMKDEYAKFVTTLGNSNSTIAQVKAAVLDLANAYLNTLDVTDQMDASEKAMIIEQLTRLGITNAEEWLNARIDAYSEILKAYQIDLNNYNTAEEAKLAAFTSTAIGIEALNNSTIQEIIKSYGNDLKNFKGTEEEKVKLAKEAAKKIAQANFAAAMASYNSQVATLDTVNNANDARKEQNLARKMQADSTYTKALKAYNDAIAEIDSIDTIFNNKDINDWFSDDGDIDWSKFEGLGDGGDSSTELDWLDHYFTAIENKIKEKEADLENVMSADVGSIDDKNTIIDGIISLYEDKMSLLETAMKAYEDRATKLFNSFSSDIQNKILNGSINIDEYDGELAEDIQNYFDYKTKASDLDIELGGVKVKVADLSLQKFNNDATAFDNEIEEKFQSDQDLIEAEIGYLEEQGKRVSPELYQKLIDIQKDEQKVLENKKKTLEDILANEVAAGHIQVGSEQWYEMKNAINDVDEAIIQSKNDIESFQNAINDIYWDNFDKLINQIEAVNSELSNLFDLFSDDDKVVDEFGNWTDEGIASLGLLAQQMENAQAKADEYANAIKQLEEDYAAGKYSQDEYNEKMAELKDSYLSEIKNIEDLKDEMVNLNKVRIDAVKEAIDKEIEALEEKNEKLKESLDLEKEQYDWQKSVAEKEKSIADIQRRLNALAGDNSASAIAERRKLQAELAEAQQEMDDMWYEHSIDEQQKALDESLDNYKENKEDEKEALDKWLEDEEKVIQESFDLFNSNVDIVSSVLKDFEEEHGIKLTEAITDPWNSGIDAMEAYRKKLAEMKQEQEDAKKDADDTADDIKESLDEPQPSTPSVEPSTPTTAPSTTTPSTTTQPTTAPSYREYTVKKNDTLSGIAKSELGKASRWQEIYNLNKDKIKDPNLIYPGQKIKLPHYAKGTMGAEYDHWAMVDEFGPELQLVPDGSGRLSYITKGTSVIPHDLSEKLVDLALDPTKVLDQSRPKLGAPHITTNNFDIDLSFGSLVHVDHCDQNTLPDLQKMVRGEFDNMMKTLNQKLKRK